MVRGIQQGFAGPRQTEKFHNASRKDTMLILTRKKGTSIKIGQDVVLHVIQTGRSTVKIGIEAPANVRIIRGELPTFPDRFEHDSSPEESLLLQH
jgi:carbon storage regulator CsrA